MKAQWHKETAGAQFTDGGRTILDANLRVMLGVYHNPRPQPIRVIASTLKTLHLQIPTLNIVRT